MKFAYDTMAGVFQSISQSVLVPICVQGPHLACFSLLASVLLLCGGVRSEDWMTMELLFSRVSMFLPIA